MASVRERKPAERVTPQRKRTRGQSQRDTKLHHSRQNRVIQEMGTQETLRSQPFLICAGSRTVMHLTLNQD